MMVITDSRRGGAPHRLAAVARDVGPLGWRVLFVSLMPAGDVLVDLAHDGIDVHSLNMVHRKQTGRALKELRALIDRWRPSIVQSSLWHANLLARVAGLGKDCFIVNAYESLDAEKTRTRTFVDILSCGLADAHYAVSPSVAERVRTRERIKDVRVIYAGVDVVRRRSCSSRSSARSRWLIPDAARVVAWTGRVHPVKNLELLIRALALLPGWWLVIAGDGPHRDQVARQAEEAGLSGRCVMTGELADVTPVLDLADVFCLTSHWEGVPISLLEAMSAGVPCVCRRVGGIPDVIQHGKNGLLVDAPSPELFARTITSALDHPHLGEAGKKTVAERFSNTSAAKAHVELWDSLLRP